MLQAAHKGIPLPLPETAAQPPPRIPERPSSSPRPRDLSPFRANNRMQPRVHLAALLRAERHARVVIFDIGETSVRNVISVTRRAFSISVPAEPTQSQQYVQRWLYHNGRGNGFTLTGGGRVDQSWYPGQLCEDLPVSIYNNTGARPAMLSRGFAAAHQFEITTMEQLYHTGYGGNGTMALIFYKEAKILLEVLDIEGRATHHETSSICLVIAPCGILLGLDTMRHEHLVTMWDESMLPPTFCLQLPKLLQSGSFPGIIPPPGNPLQSMNYQLQPIYS
ncbi:hypothetical protein SARC_00299 [Sphaeroforma arctica JP610]|uniref:Uncharacterized protein n=1 Tax=Sphaeroforma arctica JP610 TaxID=667725 RepID=A0A0L0GFH8_9EUKA|nr:hypothetical protein SARC_00299 [Sphaeroforma arctica JP610]KNC87599.1 hypothetical protein SARC_00299 [Sphaeroforma arctica JP610]|eukprot:XP_014161501.1 hypothetical protein SARC_00299 [Sphaeroforma arctica JP610]